MWFPPQCRPQSNSLGFFPPYRTAVASEGSTGSDWGALLGPILGKIYNPRSRPPHPYIHHCWVTVLSPNGLNVRPEMPPRSPADPSLEPVLALFRFRFALSGLITRILPGHQTTREMTFS